MTAWHGDGIGPDDFADPAPYLPDTRIMVTVAHRSETVADVEVRHSEDVTGQQAIDLLSDVVTMLRASGPGVLESGVIFGGLIGEVE